MATKTTKADIVQLKKLAERVQAGPTMTDEEIRITQRLVGQGLARDFSFFYGHRQRVYLRIWGITDAGKAVLEQQTIGKPAGHQMLFRVEDKK